MAMTPDDARHGEPLPSGPPIPQVLEAAAADLRRRLDERWVEISDRVVARALTASRRSYPVRAQAASGPVQVSEQVLVSYLREAIDRTVPGSALAHVALEIRGRDELVGVLIQLVGQYGIPLLPVADRVRELAVECLDGLLGPVRTPVTVSTLHVHFAGVVVGDPAESG